MGVKIIGTGSALPKNVVTNDDLAKIVETNNEWISSRTGITQRRIAINETVTSLSAEASMQAITNAGINSLDIDMILVATMSADHYLPNAACEVQSLIGAVNATCFDINAACSGFIYALNTASAFIHSKMSKTILIIGAEVLSKIIDWTDRGTCVLFGDGAGAAIVQFSENSSIMDTVTGSDGSKGHFLTCRNRGITNPYIENTNTPPLDYMKMDGQDVFKFAVTRVPESISVLLEKTNTPIEEIDYFILHQANARILSSVAKKLHVSVDKFFMNLDKYGNTSAASIPIALDELVQTGKLVTGNKIILSGFGGGLTWGSTLINF